MGMDKRGNKGRRGRRTRRGLVRSPEALPKGLLSLGLSYNNGGIRGYHPIGLGVEGEDGGRGGIKEEEEDNK